MKPFRLVFIGTAALLFVLLVAVAIAFNGTFQTWAARKFLARHPSFAGSVGSVDVGLHHVVLTELRLQRDGMLLTAPRIEGRLSTLAAAFRSQVAVERLVARGWTLDLSRRDVGSVNPPIDGATAAAAASSGFAGVFSRVEMPFDFSLDNLDLEGEVVLPSGSGRAKVVVAGGGLAAGKEGTIELKADAALSDPLVSVLTATTVLRVTLDTPRTLRRIESTTRAAARGEKVPNGASLQSEMLAERENSGEHYTFALAGDDRTLLHVEGRLPSGVRRLEGTWKINLRDTDLTPFALGVALPAFSAEGEGTLVSDPTLDAIHAGGRILARADRLAAIRPELGGVGAVDAAIEFDVAQAGSTVTVEKLHGALTNAAQRFARFDTLQPFTFDLATRQFVAREPARDLLSVNVDGVPLGWIRPFTGLNLEGETVRGTLIASTRGGGLHVRTASPMQANAVKLGRDTAPWLADVDLSLEMAADYAPQGWQAEIVNLSGSANGKTLLTLAAKAGQLAGEKQPIKTTGEVAFDLAVLRSQPLASDLARLSAGRARVNFAASFDTTRELQADVTLDQLQLQTESGPISLPSISTALRADLAASGQLKVNLPLHLERDGRKSDLTISGAILPEGEGFAIDGQLTSNQLVFDDVVALAGLIPPHADRVKGPTDSPVGVDPSAAPPWQGLTGTLAVTLKRVTYAKDFEASDVTGRLRLSKSEVRFEGLRMGVGSGKASLDGKMSYEAKLPQPYGAAIELALSDFDPGPLLRALVPEQPPTVEGNFQVSSNLRGRAETLSRLAASLYGDLRLSSRGGVFRGLPVSVASIVENTGLIAGWLASASNAIGDLARRRETEALSKAQAVGELAKRLSAIPYDQLNVVISRDASLDAAVKDLTLISPEVRLSGRGHITHQPGANFLTDRLNLEFELRARDQVANLLRRIGRLDANVDQFGYAACTLPLKVGGTIGRPQTGELNRALVAIALEKTGVSDKAAEFMERILGK